MGRAGRLSWARDRQGATAQLIYWVPQMNLFCISRIYIIYCNIYIYIHMYIYFRDNWIFKVLERKCLAYLVLSSVFIHIFKYNSFHFKSIVCSHFTFNGKTPPFPLPSFFEKWTTLIQLLCIFLLCKTKVSVPTWTATMYNS